MADETPGEREQRLQMAEERLQKQHQRTMESRQNPPSTGGVGAGVGGFFATLGDHKFILIGAVLGIAIVAYVIFKGRASSQNTANQQGALGNAGYQDSGVAYALTQLGQQLNNLQATMSAPPTTNPTVPPPSGNPIIPAGQWPTGAKWATGTHITWQGNPWTVIVGNQGRIFGAPGFLTAQQALTVQNAPLLYQVPNWQPLSQTQAAHSPIQSYLLLSPMANKAFDLSNASVSSNSTLSPSQHPGYGLSLKRSA